MPIHGVFDADGRCLDPGVEKLVRSVASNLLHYLGHALCPAIELERLLREGAA